MSGLILQADTPNNPTVLSPGDEPTRAEGMTGGKVASPSPRPQILPPGLEAHTILIAPGFLGVFNTVGTGLRLLLWLVFHAGQDGILGADPVPLSLLAAALNESRSTIKGHLRRLKLAGFIEMTGSKEGVRIRVKLLPYFGSVVDRNVTDSESEQPLPRQELNPPQPSGQKPGPRPNRASLLLALYKEFCRTQGFQPHLSRFERQSLLLFLQRYPKLRSEELQRAFENFCGMVEPENATLSKFVRESERELAAGLSGVPERENQSEEGVRL
jgi:DNA-binding MarR family transcriptional regulator